MAAIHRFESQGDAYDQSQCRDDIRDGDLLVVRQTVAILCGAWPVAVRGEAKEFHALEAGVSWKDHEGGKYWDSFVQAESLDLFPTPLEVITDRINEANEDVHATMEQLQEQIQWCQANNKPDLRRSLEAAYRGTLDRWGEIDKLRTALKDAKFKWEMHEYAVKHGIPDDEAMDHKLRATIDSCGL